MNARTPAIGLSLFVLLLIPFHNAHGQPKPEVVKFEPFTWKSDPPADCPFERSKDLTGIRFLGVKSGFRYGDTWYPSWAADDKLYSPWTDGAVLAPGRLRGGHLVRGGERRVRQNGAGRH